MRERILDTAAEMFASKGFAGTSTREIAEKVGIKQASLYYYFSNKKLILEELLYWSLLPTLACAYRLDELDATPRQKFAILTLFDIRLLFRFRHNVGGLYTLPEVRGDQFAEFTKDKALLGEYYSKIVADVERLNSPARDPALVLNVIYAIVESVTTARDTQDIPTAPALIPILMESCLRVVRTPDDEITELIAHAERVSAAIASQIPDQRDLIAQFRERPLAGAAITEQR